MKKIACFIETFDWINAEFTDQSTIKFTRDELWEYVIRVFGKNYKFWDPVRVEGTIKVETPFELIRLDSQISTEVEGYGNSVVKVEYEKKSFYKWGMLLWLPIWTLILVFLGIDFFSLTQEISSHVLTLLFYIGIPLLPVGLIIPFFIKLSYKLDEKALANLLFDYLSRTDVTERPVGESMTSFLRFFKEKKLDPSECYKCPICGCENPLTSKECVFCHAIFPTCLICRKLIIGEKAVFCPHCNAPYHKLEFLEWLKINASCKICKKEMDLWEFQKYLEKNQFNGETVSMKCENCKELIPNDSRFCIFCGIEIRK